MKKLLWINTWAKRRKDKERQKGVNGSNFIENYIPNNDFKQVLIELCQGIKMYQGSKSSHYLTFIPPNNQEVIKLRISDHPSNEHEWEEKEMTGLPNRRYSIVIFSNKSMPNESVQNIKELKWESYISQNIPVHEKSFNRYYLNETYEILKKILLSIFNGGSPEDKSITIKINENKINMKRTIRLTESDLNKIVKSSVHKILKENLEASSPQSSAYQLMLMLGEIQNKLNRGGEAVSVDEINEMYGLACELNDYFEAVH